MTNAKLLLACAAVLVAAAQVAAAAEAGIHLTTGVISTCRCVLSKRARRGLSPLSRSPPLSALSRPQSALAGPRRPLRLARGPAGRPKMWRRRPSSRPRPRAGRIGRSRAPRARHRERSNNKRSPFSLSSPPPPFPLPLPLANTNKQRSDEPARRASARRRLSAIAADGTEPAGFSDARWGPHLGRQQYILALANGEKSKGESRKMPSLALLPASFPPRPPRPQAPRPRPRRRARGRSRAPASLFRGAPRARAG